MERDLLCRICRFNFTHATEQEIRHHDKICFQKENCEEIFELKIRFGKKKTIIVKLPNKKDLNKWRQTSRTLPKIGDPVLIVKNNLPRIGVLTVINNRSKPRLFWIVFGKSDYCLGFGCKTDDDFSNIMVVSKKEIQYWRPF